MRFVALILIYLFCLQNVYPQNEVYSLFLLKKEGKALKWVQKTPNKEINLAGFFEDLEKENYSFFNPSCQFDKLKVHPFVLASFFGQKTVVDFYLNRKEIVKDEKLLATAFASSVHLNDIDLIKKFMDAGASKIGFCPLCNKRNVLQLALGNNCSDEIVDLFYKEAVTEDFLYLDCNNLDVLMCATGYSNSKFFKEICDKYPSILTRTDLDGNSALTFAIYEGSLEKVNYLLNKLQPKELETLEKTLIEKSKENFLSIAIQSESSEMIDLILDKKLGYPTTSDVDDLENNVEVEYFYEFFTWQYSLKLLLKADKDKVLQDDFLKEQVKYSLLPQQIEFVQEYLRKKVNKVQLNDELTELLSLLEEDYSVVTDFLYSSRIYETNIIDFRDDDYGYYNLLRDVDFLFPNIYELRLNTYATVLESFDKNIKKLSNVQFVVIVDSQEKEVVELPVGIYNIERLTIESDGNTVFKFPPLQKNDVRLKEVYLNNAKSESIPKGIIVNTSN